MVVIGQDCYICAKVVVFEQKLLFSGKNGCIRAKWLYFDKVVVFGQKWLYSGKSGFIRENGCIRIK